uniref:Conserved oligomeric Golgi complex subunit 4 n=1 Tax=Romanomermis culicivorax TaxID=13658 RepID=A0A915JXX6_ROMCU
MLSINNENKQNQPDESRLAVVHSDSLTMLLEGVARIFEVHQPLVETYYGPEYVLTLAEVLQEQCDEEASHILDQFVQNRKFNVKYKLIDKYGRSSTAKINEKIDLLELDQVLSEVALLQTRTELYFRFIKRRVANGLRVTAQNFVEKSSVTEKVPNKEKIIILEKLVRECRLGCRVQELIGRYILMEEFYTRETLSKAVELNAGGDDAGSLVDDVFYVVRKSVQRASSSSNVDCLCAVVNNACALLETDFYHLLQQKLKNGYPAAGSLAEAYTTATAYVSVVHQGKIPAPYGTDSAEKARSDFLATLNAVDSAAECIKGLKETLTHEIEQNFQQSSLSGDEFSIQETRQMTAKVDNCCSQLVDLAAKFENLAFSACDQLMNVAAKQRLKLIAERFADYSHILDENQFNEYEASDPFMEYFVTTLDSLLETFRKNLSDNNYDQFFKFVADETAKQLEKTIFKCSFNRLGALLFDKQVRELTAYYSGHHFSGGGGFAVREKFSRLTQTASILNVDTLSEAKEFYQSSSTVAWRLSAQDVKKILQMRQDFGSDENTMSDVPKPAKVERTSRFCSQDGFWGKRAAIVCKNVQLARPNSSTKTGHGFLISWDDDEAETNFKKLQCGRMVSERCDDVLNEFSTPFIEKPELGDDE